MAAGKHGSPDIAVFLIGGYNFLANKVKNVSRKVEELLERSDGLGDSWPEFVHTGMSQGDFSQDGAIFDDTTNRMHTALKTGSSTLRVGLVVWGGNVVGAACTGFAGVIAASYEVLGQLAGLVKANAAYGVTGQVEEGLLLLAHAAQTANWTSAAVDNGVSSANGGGAVLQVSAFSGFSTVTVKVRHSVDNVTYVDLITFTAVTSGPTAERKTVAGTVNRYLLTTGTVTGSGSISPCVGFARG
jgi:hypothetical protein